MAEPRPDQANTGQPRRPPEHGVLPGEQDLDQDLGAMFPVVGIGASAGGLEACGKLLEAMPAMNGMAFILIQHLDPNHESMMVNLLAGRTRMTVRQAMEGMLVERDHLYVIPPGVYLSVEDGVLRLSSPRARHGARLPFDFLLHAMAKEYEARAICVILSGTGTDGSLGLQSVKDKGGLVIAQDPNEAGYDGMPRGAILTGAVDQVLPAARIPEALFQYSQRLMLPNAASGASAPDQALEWLPEIIELLRVKTPYDFTLYKHGTLRRRIERRMAMAAIKPGAVDHYLGILRGDKHELDLLAQDLLINVTSFFRDPETFALLAEKIVPEIVRGQAVDHPLRLWIAGCSTGEETYSLAMIFQEVIAAAGLDITLQVFASDIDPDAIAHAREGLYPETIKANVPAERLARFFVKENHGYRVSLALRAVVVFTVQDVLADPPLSRLDFISCRNLMIYLRPEAQNKIIARFHFALRSGGILLLGRSETIGAGDGRFAVISKQEHIYRRIGHARTGSFDFSIRAGSNPRVDSVSRLGPPRTQSRRTVLGDLAQRLVMEAHAPATVLINRASECLYSLGSTDRYLRVAPGHPSNDLLTMAREGVRARLRSAIERAWQENKPVVIAGGRITHDGDAPSFSIDARPVLNDGEDLLLISFIEEPAREHGSDVPIAPDDLPRVAELEGELEATRAELRNAIHELEISSEDQNAMNEEAFSVNEEFQAANEELLASKEELQSLNEELTALNTQLHETLALKRVTSNDLQNVLYSTDVATLFLDIDLNIRLFTPATKSLFNIIPGDVGRPLADLNALAADSLLAKDAKSVLRTLAPMEREIEAHTGIWYMRRILPYRTQNDEVEGIVITFVDITSRKQIADALETAKRQADLANAAKSRFLAAASHDLRQPLQALVLLHGLLMKTVESEKARRLVVRLDETVGAMSGMLNALLDINQIEAGNVHPEITCFPVNEMFDRLREEFNYHAQSRQLVLHVVKCGLSICTDQRLLEQMIRNLLSNALKYTKHGKVLLGCRRHAGKLSIEVWDTGIGIPANELRAIFDEYYQLDNAARERSHGLGLGLSIVQRLSTLLGHRISVRSNLGKGSVFSVEVALEPDRTIPLSETSPPDEDGGTAEGVRRTGAILVIEDDPEVCELLELLLKGDGHRVATARDGITALQLVARGAEPPDLILADYNLPNGMDGLQVTATLREKLGRQVPVVILTGDISTVTLREIAVRKYAQLNKPVKTKDLTDVIQKLLPVARAVAPSRSPPPATEADAPTIFVVDDDRHVRDALRLVLEEDGRTVEDYASCEAFLDAWRPGREGCLLIDAYLPGMNGLELLQWLRDSGHRLPAIMITGFSDVAIAVQAMKVGATDFIEKPISPGELLASVERALELSRDSGKLRAVRQAAAHHVADLTTRQREIMDLVLAGHPSKNIAADLGISQRTVENHRASIMKKTGVKSLPALARLALAAAWNGKDEPGG